MNNIFIKLNSNTEYTVIDVNLLDKTKDNKSYRVRTVFKYLENGYPTFCYRYANIQFARQIRIGTTWKGNLCVKTNGVILAKLPEEILSGTGGCIFSLNKFSDENLHFGRFNYPENSPEKYYYQKVKIYELKRKIEINGRLISFVTVPTYEIIRFFLFGFNKYNEILMGGSFLNTDESNKIFNPAKSEIRETEHGETKVVRLRKEIPNSCGLLAGDLKFNNRVRALAEIFVNTSNSINHEGLTKEAFKKNAFDYAFIPVSKCSTFEAYGKLIKDKNGNEGFEITSIADMVYTKPYEIERDNDGTTTAGKRNDMPKAFGGKRKKKLNNKIQNKSVGDHIGDKDMGSISITQIIDTVQLKDRDLRGVKVIKTEQNFIADNQKPGDDIEGKGVGADSKNGGTGSDRAAVDNDHDLNNDYINDSKYWQNFSTIITGVGELLRSQLLTIKYLNNHLEWQIEPTKTNYSILSGDHGKEEIYVVEININSSAFYIVEHNTEKFSIPTLIYWNTYGQLDLKIHGVIQLLKANYLCNGIGKKVVDYLKDEYFLEYKSVRHQYEIKKTKPTQYYTTEKAIENQSRKIVEFINYSALLD
ncbi:MAG: hypothetical protein RI922_1008 [Bacteroidota bacterium]